MQSWLEQHPGEALPARLEELIYGFAMNCAAGLAPMSPSDFATEYGKEELSIHLQYTAWGLDRDNGIGVALGSQFDATNWHTVTNERVRERLTGRLDALGEWILAARPYSRNVTLDPPAEDDAGWTMFAEQQQSDWAIERFAVSPKAHRRGTEIRAAVQFSCFNSAQSGFMQYGSVQFSDSEGSMDLGIDEIPCDAPEDMEVLDDEGRSLGTMEVCSDFEYFNTLAVSDVQELVRWFIGRTGLVIRIPGNDAIGGDWHVSLLGAADAVRDTRAQCLNDKPRG